MSSIWAATCWGLAIAYVRTHGLDGIAVGLFIAGAFPVWTFIAKKVDAKVPGVHVIIDSEVTDSFKVASENAPKVVKRAQVVAKSLSPATGRLEVTLERATIRAEGTLETKHILKDEHRVVQEWQTDPNLLLVAVRIGIERRVRVIAKLLDLDEGKPLPWLIRSIQERGVFLEPFSASLRRLVDYGNRAAHGDKVDVDAKTAAQDADELFKTLDEVIERLRQ